MIYILSSLVLFLLSFVVQISLHRILLLKGKRTFATIHVFFLGALFNIGLQLYLWQNNYLYYYNGSLWFLPLPLSSIVLYLFLFLSYIIYSASPYLKDIGPTQKIITFLQKNGPKSEREIIHSLTDEELIFKRIRDLENSKWVLRKKNTLSLMPTGEKLARAILVYRNILRLRTAG